MAEVKNKIDWQTIIRRIKAGKCTPIISYHLSRNILADHKAAIKGWADEVSYPLADRHNLTRIAQYISIERDALSAKEEYLDYVKRYLLDWAKSKPSIEPRSFLDELEENLADMCFSEVAKHLNYPGFATEQDNPLRILASLPLPIYLTTNYSTFMEEALKTVGKEPRTEICYWYDGLGDKVPSVFDDPDYQPSVEMPLVYHVHGLDTYPDSLVLTEDDYLDFLVKVSDLDVIPKRVAQALTDSSLLLLGYQLDDWDFRVVFRGLITSKHYSRRLLSLSIQLMPDEEGIKDINDAQEYLQRYFGKAHFEIYWGDAQGFTRELWEHWGN